jgi:YesN/AraC family two-component response regulator
MKAFTIIYTRTVREDAVVEAKNEKEALKKFKEIKPDVRVIDIQMWYDLRDF